MSSLFGLGQDLDFSLFVTPVSPQALLEGRTMASFKKKKLILVICFVLYQFVYLFLLF